MSYLKEYNFNLLDMVIFDSEDIKPINWYDFFKNNNSLVVEAGCGNGHFLTKKAIEDKDKNFIGIDIKKKRIIRCREKQVKYGINNIGWICGEALSSIQNIFNDNSIFMIYMPFPDPWPKRRHHKHRLFKKDFIDVFYKKLLPGGVFIFITDYKEYYDASYKLILSDERFKLINNNDNYNQELTNSIFGEKWKKQNRNFYCFEIKKI